MPIREEGMSLRLIADSASLKSGRREVQEWTKQVNELSKRIKTGLGTKEDFARLKEYQQSASKNYQQLQTKLEGYTRQRESYLRQIGEAPTAGLRKEAGLRERGIRGMMREITGQQARLGGLGEAAGAGMGGAPAGGGFRRGAGRALGFARGLPMVGGLLGVAGLTAGIMGAARYSMELETSAARVAMSYADAGEGTGKIAKDMERMKNLGKGFGFAPGELIPAQAAAVRAGGGAMAGAMPFIAEYARMRGIDPNALAAMMGTGVRGAGAFRPETMRDFLMRAEGITMRAQPQARLTTEAYMQTTLPFLQAQGKFQAYTGSSEDAINRLYAGLSNVARQQDNPVLQNFVNRNFGAAAGALSQAIRAPQGPAAQFFTMRALGMGEPGVRYYDVWRKQQAGLTEESLLGIVGRAGTLARGYGGRVGGMKPHELFAKTLSQFTGGAISPELGEALFKADITNMQDLRDTLKEQGIKQFDKLMLPEDVKAIMELHETLKNIAKDIGDIAKQMIGPIAEVLQPVALASRAWADLAEDAARFFGTGQGTGGIDWSPTRGGVKLDWSGEPQTDVNARGG